MKVIWEIVHHVPHTSEVASSFRIHFWGEHPIGIRCSHISLCTVPGADFANFRTLDLLRRSPRLFLHTGFAEEESSTVFCILDLPRRTTPRVIVHLAGAIRMICILALRRPSLPCAFLSISGAGFCPGDGSCVSRSLFVQVLGARGVSYVIMRCSSILVARIRTNMHQV